MNISKKDVKKIRGLIIFAGVVLLALIKFDLLCEGLVFLISIIRPFILGGMIAFIINIPMRFFEKKLFDRKKDRVGGEDQVGREDHVGKEDGVRREDSAGKKDNVGKGKGVAARLKRPVSLLIAVAAVLLALALVIWTVVPQLVKTISVLAKEIPIFMGELTSGLELLLAGNPELLSSLNSLQLPEINWQEALQMVVDFLKNGMGSMLSSTFTVASNIVSGAVNFFIALIFSFYILLQKEKLGGQFERTIRAYTRPAVYEWIMKVLRLLHQNFSNFITGQCLEALILGTLFVVTMTLFRFPFAFMVGVLIAFTALIPIVGAFIGCFVGAFLILVDSPEKVIWFLILFIVLQQLEGNLIYPHVVGNSVGLPSIWVLAAVTFGGSLMGVVGMLIFIPLLSTAYVLIREDVNQRNGNGTRGPGGPKGPGEPKEPNGTKESNGNKESNGTKGSNGTENVITEEKADGAKGKAKRKSGKPL